MLGGVGGGELGTRCLNTGETCRKAARGKHVNCRKRQGSADAGRKWINTGVMEAHPLQDRTGWLVLVPLQVKETSESSVVPED